MKRNSKWTMKLEATRSFYRAMAFVAGLLLVIIRNDGSTKYFGMCVALQPRQLFQGPHKPRFTI